MIKEMRNRIVMSALDAGYNVIIDETMLTRKSRAELRMFPARYFHGVYFDTPVDVCIERRLRDTKGGSDDWEEIITNMNKTFEQPALCEFDLITVIKGGQHGSMPSL